MDKITRRTLHIGDALNAMLESGRVSGSSVSQRVDRLADRYAALVHDLAPARLSIGEWLLLATVLRTTTINKPGDAAVLSVRLKQMGKGGAGQECSGLGYKVEGMKLPELLSVVDVLERAQAAGADTAERLAAFLEQAGVSHQA